VLIKVGVVVAAATFAVTTLQHVAGTLGLIAGMVVSLGIMAAGLRVFWRFVRGLENVVENTNALPAFMRDQTETNRKVHDRLESGAVRMASIEATLQTWGTAERVGITTAIEASKSPSEPRPSRRTDPAPRTGWRE
jgi:hypothetical protein